MIGCVIHQITPLEHALNTRIMILLVLAHTTISRHCSGKFEQLPIAVAQWLRRCASAEREVVDSVPGCGSRFSGGGERQRLACVDEISVHLVACVASAH